MTVQERPLFHFLLLKQGDSRVHVSLGTANYTVSSIQMHLQHICEKVEVPEKLEEDGLEFDRRV